MALLNWHIVDSATFIAGEKHDNCIYFLSDTREIYRGNVPFTESVIMYTEIPTSGIAVNRLYINSTTLEGRVWDGAKWTVVIRPVADTVTIDGADPVSGKAVANYVAAKLAGTNTPANTVASLTWDSLEHILTVTKGDASSETIVFDGLGADLVYTKSTGELQLVDASGNTIGSAVKLDLERFVTAGEYDAENKSIVLYFDAEKTDSVTIPVEDLVDTYTAEGTNGLNLTVEGSVIKGSVKISTDSGNLITLGADGGIYVAPIDISSKMDKVTDATEGNIATFGADGQVIDSGKSFNDIGSTQKTYYGDTLEAAITGVTPNPGDHALVRTQIGTTGMYTKIPYVYDGETSSWVRMTEQLSADDVYFPENIIITKQFGKYVPGTDGTVELPAGAKSLTGLIVDAYSEDVMPTIVQPSVSVSMAAAKAYEVGTVVTPSYTATLNPGSYGFGTTANKDSTATGITASSWSVKDTDGRELTTNTGSFDAITVTDGISYQVTATATYEAGLMPITALKNEYSAGQIAAGSKSGSSGKITGYRNSFYGTLTTQGELTIDTIRGLTKSGKTLSNGSTFNITIPVGCVRCVIAYPATLRDLTEVIDVNGMQTNIVSAFGTPTQMDIPGANDYEAIAYKVYVYDFTAAGAENTYKVKI